MNETSDRNEGGFTLIELLVVILIIGILAAIAIPAFLSQRAKAQDANAKANARNLVSQMEVCYRDTEGYVGCTAKLTSAETGLSIGSGPAQVRVTSETSTGYQIIATSKAQTGGTNHIYRVTQNIGGTFARDCQPLGEGGCKDDGGW